MKFRSIFTGFLILIFANSAFALTGLEIMKKSDALPQPDTAKSKIIMRIHKGKRMNEKAFTLLMKQYPNDEDKAIISFSRPTRIKLLTHSHKGRDDDQWLRLSSGRIKRVASSSKGKPFVNSHFYYEDLSSVDIDDYDFKLIGEGKALGAPCYKVEGVKKTGEKVYDHLVFYVRKSDFFVVRIDFYKKGKFHKFLENYDVKKVNGILTPFRMSMKLANGKGRTDLFVVGLKYNADIPDNKFRKEALR
ncbi:MAG: outer membrane lipoprotein-sorting protein [Deltaproteobacteria bacterium]|nr:outer membrane lipoprotein-sorting protein [Deltaproteobacteria bacterium]